jgi:hypothetical protein
MINFKQYILEQQGWKESYTDLLDDISKYFPKMTEDDKKAIIEYAADVRIDYGFAPSGGETIDDIYHQLSWVYGEDNGLINTDDISKANKHVIKQWYKGSKFYKKQKEVKKAISKNNQSGWDL